MVIPVGLPRAEAGTLSSISLPFIRAQDAALLPITGQDCVMLSVKIGQLIDARRSADWVGVLSVSNYAEGVMTLNSGLLSVTSVPRIFTNARGH